MNLIICFSTLGLPAALSLFSSLPRPHEQTTHGAITKSAAKESARFEAALAEARLDSLPLSATWILLAKKAGEDICIPGTTARDHLIAGSILEDGVEEPLSGELAQFTSARCLRHFMNRDSDGLFGDDDLGTEFHFLSAQQWGYGGYDSLMTNGFTWETALEEYMQSALAPTFEERRVALERALIALGCNLHLLQDQFSPAHTRDDPHPGHALGFPYTVEGWAAEFFMGSSLLESEGPRFVNLNDNDFETSALPLIHETRHEAYFTSAVQWTADRFFSDDTILEFLERPNSSDVMTSDVDTCWDFVTGDDYLVSRTLDVEGTKLAYRRYTLFPDPFGFDWSLMASECDDSEGLPYFDRPLTIVKANLRELIPRATAYSAGLLDHFFRGRIVASQDESGNLVITNRSASYGSGHNTIYGGTFHIAVSHPSGARSLQLVYGSPGVLAAEESVTIPRGLLWQAASLATPVATLHIVLDGQIGEERGVAITAFDYVDRDGICDEVCGSTTLSPAGDVDGDGHPDLVQGYYPFPFSTLPWARVVSPFGCREIKTLPKDFFASQGIQAGYGAYGAGDVDGDGHADLFLVGTQASASSSWLVSGASWQILEQIPEPWGSSLSRTRPLGDLDGDGRAEFLVDSSRNGEFVASALPFTARFPCVFEAEIVRDSNGDGRQDLRLRGSSTTQFASGTNGQTIYLPQADSTFPFDFTHYRDLTPVQDIDGDGIADLFGADPYDDANPSIMVISGSNGDPLWSRFEGDHVDSGWVGEYDAEPGDEILLTVFDNNAWSYRLVHVNDGGDATTPTDQIPPTLWYTLLGVPIGDLDGDGAVDRAYLRQDTTCWEILFGGTDW